MMIVGGKMSPRLTTDKGNFGVQCYLSRGAILIKGASCTFCFLHFTDGNTEVVLLEHKCERT